MILTGKLIPRLSWRWISRSETTHRMMNSHQKHKSKTKSKIGGEALLQPIHSCFECDKAFTTIQGQKKHVKLQTGEKPYSCEECNKAFRSSFNLKTQNYSQTKRQKKYQRRHLCLTNAAWMSKQGQPVRP